MKSVVVIWAAAAFFGVLAVGVAFDFFSLAMLTGRQPTTVSQDGGRATEPEGALPAVTARPGTQEEIGSASGAPVPEESSAMPVRPHTQEEAPASAFVDPYTGQQTRQRPVSSVHPSVAADAVALMEQIVAAREATFPWVRAAWEASIVVPFDETLDSPCGGSRHGCMISGGGGPAEVWISLEAIREEPPSDPDPYGLRWSSQKRSLGSVLLHELAHVLDLTAVGDAIDRGDAFRAASQGFRDHYAGCRFGRFDAVRSGHELLAETIAVLSAGRSFGRWTELDGCLASLPPPDEHIDNLGFALAGCGSVSSLDDLGRDRSAKWCPDEFDALEAADARAAAQREAEALAVECRDDIDTSWRTGATSGPLGWERGCKEAGHIPDEVPCVVWWVNGWVPGYFSGNGECAENEALQDSYWRDGAWSDTWRDCLPDDGGRWRGDWTANPDNGRDACPEG